MKICFVTFGRYEPVKEAITEAVRFIGDYMPLETTLIEIEEDIEPSRWNDCYFAHAGDIKPFEDKIPKGYDIYICLWRAQGETTCWLGGTWGKEYGIHNAWLCSIPYDLPDCYNKVSNQWNYRLSQRIVHETLNALHGMGVTTKSPEKCVEYGFSDPEGGWKECYVECLKTYRGDDMGEWRLVWESDEYTVNVVKPPETPFQPSITVVAENLRIPAQVEISKIVYCGDIQIRTDKDYDIRWKGVTVVNDEEINPKVDTVRSGQIKTYVPYFTTPDFETQLRVKVRIYQWVG